MEVNFATYCFINCLNGLAFCYMLHFNPKNAFFSTTLNSAFSLQNPFGVSAPIFALITPFVLREYHWMLLVPTLSSSPFIMLASFAEECFPFIFNLVPFSSLKPPFILAPLGFLKTYNVKSIVICYI